MSRGTWKSKQESTRAASTGKAVIYLRVSGEEQAKHGHGIDDQLDKCKQYCTQHTYDVVAILRDEAVQGDTAIVDRQGLTQALTLCAIGQASILVASAQDRLARDTQIWPMIRHAATSSHFSIETFKEGNLTNDGSEFMGDIYAAVAAQERRTITARMLGGRRERSKRDGLGSGPLPWGWLRVGYGKQSTVVIDEQAATVIRFILRKRDEGLTYQGIADVLNGLGYKTAKGEDWTRGHVKLVDDKRALYTTGVKTWGDVASSEKWPVIYSPTDMAVK
jgi:site-specific DNA recombinase